MTLRKMTAAGSTTAAPSPLPTALCRTTRHRRRATTTSRVAASTTPASPPSPTTRCRATRHRPAGGFPVFISSPLLTTRFRATLQQARAVGSTTSAGSFMAAGPLSPTTPSRATVHPWVEGSSTRAPRPSPPTRCQATRRRTAAGSTTVRPTRRSPSALRSSTQQVATTTRVAPTRLLTAATTLNRTTHVDLAQRARSPAPRSTSPCRSGTTARAVPRRSPSSPGAPRSKRCRRRRARSRTTSGEGIVRGSSARARVMPGPLSSRRTSRPRL